MSEEDPIMDKEAPGELADDLAVEGDDAASDVASEVLSLAGTTVPAVKSTSFRVVEDDAVSEVASEVPSLAGTTATAVKPTSSRLSVSSLPAPIEHAEDPTAPRDSLVSDYSEGNDPTLQPPPEQAVRDSLFSDYSEGNSPTPQPPPQQAVRDSLFSDYSEGNGVSASFALDESAALDVDASSASVQGPPSVQDPQDGEESVAEDDAGSEVASEVPSLAGTTEPAVKSTSSRVVEDGAVSEVASEVPSLAGTTASPVKPTSSRLSISSLPAGNAAASSKAPPLSNGGLSPAASTRPRSSSNSIPPTSGRPQSRTAYSSAQHSLDMEDEGVPEDDGDSYDEDEFDALSVAPSRRSSMHPGPAPTARRASSIASSTYSQEDQFETVTASHQSSLLNRRTGTYRPSTAPNGRRPMSAMRQSSPSPAAGMRYSQEIRSSGSRPMSAAPRDRQGAIMQDLTRKHPSTWDARDVATWVEYIGMGQYRKRFMHNLVDGRLLLRLTDAQLKQEIGIGPLGHRANLLDAIASLVGSAEDKDGAQMEGAGMRGRLQHKRRPMSAKPQPTWGGGGGANYARRPTSASPNVIPPDNYLGPASGKMTVYEQRSKLLFELDRAAYRASHQKSLADQLTHISHLSTEEVAKLRGHLRDLENKNKFSMANANAGFDSSAHIPWHPVGHGTRHKNWNPERFARPGESPSVDLTFRPKLSKTSRKMLQDQSGMNGEAGGGASFLARLENDARKRQRAQQEAARLCHSVEALFADPMRAKRQQSRDFAYLNDYLISKGVAQDAEGGLRNNPNEYEEEINDIFTQHAEDWQIKDVTLRSVLAAKAEKKVTAAAAAVRTMVFMQRYESELQQKTERLKDLEKKWWEQAMGNPQKSREEEDRNQMLRWFALQGWRGEEEDAITDDRLGSLIARARAYKQLYDKWRESVRDRPAREQGEPVVEVDWNSSPFSSDGLGSLMEHEQENSRAKAESNGGAAAGNVGEATGTTGQVPEGTTIKVTPGGQGGGADYLIYTVKLLALCREDDLDMLDRFSGERKRLAVYRIIRRQKFLEFTEAKIKEKERVKKEVFEKMAPKKQQFTRKEEDVFFERLLDDNQRRQAKAQQAMAAKRAKEESLLAKTR